MTRRLDHHGATVTSVLIRPGMPLSEALLFMAVTGPLEECGPDCDARCVCEETSSAW